MKIAVIDKKDITIQVQNNSIKFLEHNIPFSLIDLLILNHKVTLNSADILKLTKNNINILLVSYNNENFSLISSANTKNANLKLSQYNALNFKLHIAKYIITQKITTHAQHLKNIILP
jgi:CRISPR/Cas system-associated endonuclease Cas1